MVTFPAAHSATVWLGGVKKADYAGLILPKVRATRGGVVIVEIVGMREPFENREKETFAKEDYYR